MRSWSGVRLDHDTIAGAVGPRRLLSTPSPDQGARLGVAMPRKGEGSTEFPQIPAAVSQPLAPIDESSALTVEL